MFTIPSHRYCFYHIDSGIFWCDYPLVNIQKTMEHHHFQWVNPLFLWSFVSLNIINHHKNDHKNHVFFIRIWLKPIRCAVAIRDLLWRSWSKLFLVRLRWVCRESQRPMTAVSIFFWDKKETLKAAFFQGIIHGIIYVDWIWYRIINGLSWKQFSSPQLAGFLLIFPSNSVEGDKRPSVHCHLMAFWPPSDPVGLPGTWIQVMKRMPNTMKCHEMPWCYGKRPTISFLVLTWLTCVFWPWKVLSLCPLFLTFLCVFLVGLSTHLLICQQLHQPRGLHDGSERLIGCQSLAVALGPEAAQERRTWWAVLYQVDLVFDDESCFTKQISISDPWNWVDPAWVAMNGREARS